MELNDIAVELKESEIKVDYPQNDSIGRILRAIQLADEEFDDLDWEVTKYIASSIPEE